MTDTELAQAIEAARVALNDLLGKAARVGLVVELEGIPADRADIRYAGREGTELVSVVTLAPHVRVTVTKRLL